jgi:thiamine-phosphate pyrophosphorylase
VDTRPRTVDLSLYLVTDRALARDRSLPSVVAAAVRGGVTCVQLREKEAPTREMLALALELKSLLGPAGVPLIVNDRLDVALAAGADGVHLGQKDLPLADARRIAGGRLVIGISAESLEDAVAAAAGGADYIGVSPVYATPTKTDTTAPLGLDGLRGIREAVAVPLVGIGGLHRENAGAVIRAGADGVAVVSALMAAEDPEEAARSLLAAVREAREKVR